MPTVHRQAFGTVCIFHSYWLPVAIEDAATFHQILSNTALALSQTAEPPPFCYVEEISHRATALQHLKKRLQQEMTATNVTPLISSIIAQAGHVNISGDFTEWSEHMAAVKRILRRVKNLKHLSKDLWLLLFWVDVTGSSREDAHPQFSIPPALDATFVDGQPWLRIDAGSTTVGAGACTILALLRTNPSRYSNQLLQVSRHVHALANFINVQANGHEALSTIWYGTPSLAGYGVMPILHELLSLRLPSMQLSAIVNNQHIAELVRLTMILFLAPIRRQLLGYPVFSHVYTAKVYNIMAFSQGFRWNDVERPEQESVLAIPSDWLSLRLYILVVALMEATDEAELDWFGTELVKTTAMLKVDGDWNLIKGLLAGSMIWCRGIHSLIARPVWERALKILIDKGPTDNV